MLGSGTVSNSGHKAGYACIAELRAAQTLKEEEPRTYLKFGDRVRIEMLDSAGQSIFGAIEQTVVQHPAPRRAVEVLARDESGETAE